MGATVRVNVELKRVEKVDATCYECRHRFPTSWQQYRTEKILCPKCQGECDYDFFPDSNPSMHISVSSIIDLARRCGVRVSSGQLSGTFDPDAVLAYEKELRGDRYGSTLLEIARAAKKARTDIVWV
jgi:hypothetical protein